VTSFNHEEGKEKWKQKLSLKKIFPRASDLWISATRHLQSTALPTELSTVSVLILSRLQAVGIFKVTSFNHEEGKKMEQKLSLKKISVEPSRTSDLWISATRHLQSTALPTELSTVSVLVLSRLQAVGIFKVTSFNHEEGKENGTKTFSKKNLSVEPSRTSDLWISATRHLQSTALPTELSTVSVLVLSRLQAVGIFKVTSFNHEEGKENGTKTFSKKNLSVEPESNQRPMDISH
ncbi:hypothetical protein TNCT_214541, partial [Trichonephila clavata]